MISMKPFIAIAAVALAGCATSSSEEPAQTPTTDNSDLSSLSVPAMIGSPTLCATASSLQLPDAAWASWFADVSYADIVPAAKPIEQNGFGKVGEADTYIGEYAAWILAKLVFDPQAAAMHDALYATVHPDRGLEFFSVGSSQLIWAAHRTLPVTILAIRGTYAVDDVLSDLDAWLVKGPLAGNVHEGFLKAEQEVEALLDQKLALLPPDQTVIVTGHSAGGAVGTLWIAHQLEKGSTRHFIHDTFGSPRVGDPAFANAFDAKTKEHQIPVSRFHYGDDPVPTQPNEFLGYQHVGMPIHLLKDSMLMNDTYVVSGLGNLHDHAKSNYFEAVTQRLLGQSPAYAIAGGSGDLSNATAGSLSVCR